jgi:hypothetical protein
VGELERFLTISTPGIFNLALRKVRAVTRGASIKRIWLIKVSSEQLADELCTSSFFQSVGIERLDARRLAVDCDRASAHELQALFMRDGFRVVDEKLSGGWTYWKL